CDHSCSYTIRHLYPTRRSSDLTTETTPLSGKKTWSSELSASMRTCSRWQRMCSSSGMSRLRLREGSASKSRLRGQSDKAFMTLNRAGIALVPKETRCDANLCAPCLSATVRRHYRGTHVRPCPRRIAERCCCRI